ncbi:MAG: hypothetical protein EA416_08305 [Trueperaceae bacterium]|nr:MAG: hypothetical protein EA416_08305 [Trueperaceae bacterium]
MVAAWSRRGRGVVASRATTAFQLGLGCAGPACGGRARISPVAPAPTRLTLQTHGERLARQRREAWAAVPTRRSTAPSTGGCVLGA